MILLRLHPSYFLQRKVIACLSTRTNTTTRSEDSSMKCYHIKGFGEKCKVTAYTNTGHEIETDLPRVIGGSDTAPQPVEYLLAAWMGCTQATAVFVGRNMRPRRLNISRLEFDLKAYRDERGAIGGSLPLRKDSPLPDVPSRLQLVSGVVKVMLKENEKVSPRYFKPYCKASA